VSGPTTDSQYIAVAVERWLAEQTAKPPVPVLHALDQPGDGNLFRRARLARELMQEANSGPELTPDLLDECVRVFRKAAIECLCEFFESPTVSWRPVPQIVAVANGFDGTCVLLLFFDPERGFCIRVTTPNTETT
jgi:hypothetical protein